MRTFQKVHLFVLIFTMFIGIVIIIGCSKDGKNPTAPSTKPETSLSPDLLAPSEAGDSSESLQGSIETDNEPGFIVRVADDANEFTSRVLIK